FDEMVELFCELRKSKGMTPEKAIPMLRKGNYFGTMLVKMGVADSLLGGATYSTADTVRPALQIIKTKPGYKSVSSCFILVRASASGENEVLSFGDCAINIHPTAEQIAETGIYCAECGRVFGIDPKVAFLSFSTHGSGKDADVDKMREATRLAQEMAPNLAIDGELQFDAAVSPSVAHTKCPESKVAGHANVFVFPDINAGNIGYKIAQRLGQFDAYGPILLGLNAPINDLSRGCNGMEVYSMAIITASLAD
ncbi:MAG: phosphate acetyltransferase, partial [Clostridiales bacterium]|nr:phosphate acetyltransferase [Clostridiales bacterium]